MSAVGGMVGGLVDTFAGGGDDERKAQDAALARARGNWNYNTHAADQAGTEYDKMDPRSRDAMMSALADYENTVKSGGLTAQGKANLAAGTSAAEQAAARSSQQIQQQAARNGTAQGPAAMVAQQVAAQQSGERARMTALDVAAQAEAAHDAALRGQVGTAGALHGVDAERARAQDAINQFNVVNAQRNIANDATRAGGATGVDLNEAGVQGKRAEQAAHRWEDAGSAIGGSVASVVPGVGQAVEGATKGIKAIQGAFAGAQAPSAGSWGDTYNGSYGIDERGT